MTHPSIILVAICLAATTALAAEPDFRGFLENHCLECHDSATKKGNLDLDTLRVLEDAIENFPGSAIVVSHDRYFLNRIVTHILAFEGDGFVNFHHGTWEDYVPWRDE